MTKHVAVLMGGWSAEREVSLVSGKACAHALEKEGYRVTPIDVQPDISIILSKLKPDVAFNALHGRYGEDGCIQGVLETLSIPYTHSGVLASALAMRKDLAKIIMEKAGVPVAPGITISRQEAVGQHLMPPPYVIKPVCEGSSFGIIIVKDEKDNSLQRLVSSEWAFGDQVLIERFIPGRELTCAVMGDKVLGIIEINPIVGNFYDFDSKYVRGGSVHTLPAQLKPEIYENIQKSALCAHQALGCRGVSRTDFRYDDTPHGTGQFIAMEVNTQPGMTETSLVPELAAHAGYSFEKLVRWMVEEASCNR